MTVYIETNHGTGDTYMTLAFAEAVQRARGQEVLVTIPPHHDPIAAMFPNVRTTHDKAPGMLPPGHEFIIAHPSAVPKRVRIDYLCLLSRRLSHADLWRAMMDLPHDEPMKRGEFAFGATIQKRVVIIPTARSWPHGNMDFWALLDARLRAEGWSVVWNDGSWSLGQLFAVCSQAEWVIGPQCGTMMILCHALFPCRKTFATPSVDGHSYFRRHWPYASVETFAGEDYAEVDEVKISNDIAKSVDEVMSGACARRLDRGSGPASSVQVPLSHGEFFDRLSILDVKQQKLTGDKRAMVMREYLRMREIAEPMMGQSQPLGGLYRDLLQVNAEAFEQNDVAVRMVLSPVHHDSVGLDHYAKAVHLNKRRTELKDKISALFGSAFGEVKSYYD